MHVTFKEDDVCTDGGGRIASCHWQCGIPPSENHGVQVSTSPAVHPKMSLLPLKKLMTLETVSSVLLFC